MWCLKKKHLCHWIHFYMFQQNVSSAFDPTPLGGAVRGYDPAMLECRLHTNKTISLLVNLQIIFSSDWLAHRRPRVTRLLLWEKVAAAESVGCVCGREQVKQQRETGSKRKTVKTQSQNNPGQNCDNMCVCALFPLVWTCCISCYYSYEDILVLLRLFGPFRIVSLRWLGATEYIMATMAMFSSEIWRVYVLILLINDLLLVL